MRERKKEALLRFINEKKKNNNIKKETRKEAKIIPPKNLSPSGKKDSERLTGKRRKERKEKLLEFLLRKKEERERLLALQLEEKRKRKAEKEKKLLLKKSKIAAKKILSEKRKKEKEERRKREKEEKIALVQAAISAKKAAREKKLKEISEKKEKEKLERLKEKKEKALQREREKEAKKFIIGISRKSAEEEKRASQQITKARKAILGFSEKFKKKEKPVKKPPAEKLPKEKPVAPPPKVVQRYGKPFQLGPFLRKNAFKFLFFLLLIGWVVEIITFASRWKTPREKFEELIGSELPERVVKKKKVKEKEKKLGLDKILAFAKEKVDIEGKRDPFSSGILTMEIIKKPYPTKIALAKKPEIISILRPIVTPEKKEEKIVYFPEISRLKKKRKLTTPSLPLTEISTGKLSRLKKPEKPSVSPIITPEKKCEFIYRGRMIMGGIEYFFLENKKRTYRVTVGDTVEGYRILKKEKNYLILSKNGQIFKIKLD